MIIQFYAPEIKNIPDSDEALIGTRTTKAMHFVSAYILLMVLRGLNLWDFCIE